MKAFKLFAGISFMFLQACRVSPNSNRDNYLTDPDKQYAIKLIPPIGSTFKFNITSSSEMAFEVNGEEYENSNKAESVVRYEVYADSSTDILFRINYEQVKLLVKNGETETSSNSANALVSGNPIDRMLKGLTETTITARVTPRGEIKQIQGLETVSEKLVASSENLDHHLLAIVKQQLDKLVGDGVVKGNMDQLFKIFPDSMVRLNDSWKMVSLERGDFPAKNVAQVTLTSVSSEIASIRSDGKLTVEGIGRGVLGAANSMSNLTGTQEGQYEIERKTGMLFSSSSFSSINGTVNVVNQQVPIEINIKSNLVRINTTNKPSK